MTGNILYITFYISPPIISKFLQYINFYINKIHIYWLYTCSPGKIRHGTAVIEKRHSATNSIFRLCCLEPWKVPKISKVKMGEVEIQKGASCDARTNIGPLIGIHQSQSAEGYEYEASVSCICY
jgi:hypothetical protein